MYKIVKISSKYEIEQLGTKEKFWVKNSEEDIKQLFKIGREGTGENWAEKVASDLAELIGLPHAHYELAQYETRLGSLCDSLVSDDERLIHGNELMVKIVDSNYPADQTYKVRDYKIETVLSLVKQMEKHFDIKDALSDFIGYIVFDCLKANQDRHHENWGFIIAANGKIRLSPTYDHAAGFGCRVSAEEAKKRLVTNDEKYKVEAFCKRAKTPFYSSKSTGRLSTLEACRAASRFDKDAFCYWVDKVAALKLQDIEKIIHKIPVEIMEETIKVFTQSVIGVNQKRLEALKEEVCK